MEATLKPAYTVGFDNDALPPVSDSAVRAEDGGADTLTDVTLDKKLFGVRVADTEEGRNSASLLINKMYSWRGYGSNHKVEPNPNRITLSATHKGEAVGTVTLGIDSEIGILADEIFKDRIDEFRARGAKVCEITKLAFDPKVNSKMALGSLFHLLFIYGHHLHQCTDVFIEINPRHRRYYETMLGFTCLGELRHNARVNAPAYLLWVSVQKVDQEIERLGGKSLHHGAERSLFPYFFSKREEMGIVHRLMAIDGAAQAAAVPA